MKLDDALRNSQFARRPLVVFDNRVGEFFVRKWLVCYGHDYFRRDNRAFQICGPDMSLIEQLPSSDIGRYALLSNDWEPWDGSQQQYVIVFRKHQLIVPMRGDFTFGDPWKS